MPEVGVVRRPTLSIIAPVASATQALAVKVFTVTTTRYLNTSFGDDTVKSLAKFVATDETNRLGETHLVKRFAHLPPPPH